jgi:hypothetical protein
MFTNTSLAPTDVSALTVYDVFTPASTALAGAVPRPAITTAIRDAMAVPGRQLFLYGRTGTGKSTALLAELARDGHDFVVVRCTPDTTLDSLLETGTDRLGVDHVADASLALPLVAAALGERRITVVLEDAHHLVPDERHRLLAALKVLSDLGRAYPTLTAVVVAAVERPSDFDDFAPEFDHRIEQVRVPTMTTVELGNIVRRGGTILGVDVEEIAEAIARCSGGSPAIAHQLALATFVEANVLVPVEEPTVLLFSDFERAVAATLGAMPREVQLRIDAAFSSIRQRREVETVLTSLASMDPDGARISHVTQSVTVPGGEYLPDVIDALTTPARGALLTRLGPDLIRFTEPTTHSYWALLVSHGSHSVQQMSALR